MPTVGAFEAKTNFSALLERVERGEVIVITRRGKPVTRLAQRRLVAVLGDIEAFKQRFWFEALRQGIRSATTVAAEALGVEDRGALAPGLLADVIAVPGDPLQDVAAFQDVRFVMVGGRVIARR